jgi:hypothetical protein
MSKLAEFRKEQMKAVIGDFTSESAKGQKGERGDKGEPGPQGPKGDPGAPGKDGVGISNAAITNGKLILTKTDGSTVDAGALTSTTTAGAPRMVGSAPNPNAPVIVSALQGYRAGCVDSGVPVQLDDLMVQLNPGNPRSLQFKLSQGTLNVNISGQIFWAKGDYTGNWSANYWNGNTLNTTWQLPFGWNFPWANDQAVYNVQDLTNRRLYRITLLIGPGYNRNYIVMERLV